MAAKLRNRMTVPAGMLHPAGLTETTVNPNVQATTRPPGTILRPSPGYDSVREGKNIFQGQGPTGGFRPLEFAEDVGGTGAALSVIPGDIGSIPDSEYLPLPDAVIISDRKVKPGFARWFHDGSDTAPDMGDRTASRPLTRSFLNMNPMNVLSAEYRKSPAMSVAMGAGLVYVVYLLAGEFERQVKSNRPGGAGSTVTDIPADAARTTGNVTGDAVDTVGKAADDAVSAIKDATDEAVKTIKETANSVTD